MSQTDHAPRAPTLRPPDEARPAPAERSFVRRTATVVGVVAAAALLLLFLWVIVDVLLLVFAGALLAVFLRGLSDRLAAWTPLSPGWALGLVTLGLVGLIVLGVWQLAPGVALQVNELQVALPVALGQVEEALRQYGVFEPLLEQASAPGDLFPNTGDLLAQATGIVSTTASAVIDVLIVLVVGLYFAVDPGLYRRGIVRLVPPGGRARAGEVLDKLGETLWWWLVGRLAAMLSVGALTALALWLLDVPLALTLGLIAGLLDFIPNVGPVVAAVPGILLALLDSPEKALSVALAYTVIQQVEAYLISPLVQQATVKLPPALSILSLVVFGVLFGPLGLLLAAPITAVGLVLVRMLYVEGVLGDAQAAEG